MKKKIGNVGALNIVSATKESLNEIEHIENVGVILHSKETAHLIPHLSIGNIGGTIEVNEDLRKVNGRFIADAHFLQSFDEPTTIMVNGVFIVERGVSNEDLKLTKCRFYVNGNVYTPNHLKGAIGSVLLVHSGYVETYDQTLPKIETGRVNVTNGYLEGLAIDTALVITGKLSIDDGVDMGLFSKKIKSLTLSGKAIIYENQQKAFYEKSIVIGKVEVIPTGYQHVTKIMQLTDRSIKRFKESSIYTRYPLVLSESITRDAMTAAFSSIHSNAYIICHEDVEDLVYECLHQFETDVIPYNDAYRFIQKEEWSKTDVEALEDSTVLIVHTDLTLSDDVEPDLLLKKLAEIHLFGTLYVANSTQKATAQKLIHTINGKIIDVSVEEKDSLGNIGELTL